MYIMRIARLPKGDCYEKGQGEYNIEKSDSIRKTLNQAEQVADKGIKREESEKAIKDLTNVSNEL